jgi:sensor histidine kinase regulating citrate/malate metabolism
MEAAIKSVLGGVAQSSNGQVADSSASLAYIAIGVSIGLVAVVAVLFLARKRISHVKEAAAGSIGNLQTEKAKSSLILNVIEDGVVVTDNQGVIRLCNPAAARLTGWEQDDTNGIDYRSVLKFTNDKNEPLEDKDDPIRTTLTSATPWPPLPGPAPPTARGATAGLRLRGARPGTGSGWSSARSSSARRCGR